MANILIVDHQEQFVESFSSELNRLGHCSIWAGNLSCGLDKLKTSCFDLVVLQARLPEGSSLDALPQIASHHPNPEVIVIGDNDGTGDGELAITNGAWDYFHKKSDLGHLRNAVNQALEYRRVNGAQSGRVPLDKVEFEGVLGNSPKTRACTEILTHAAASDAPVLITGETGTGKELFARAIHDNSPRSNRNFVVLDCAALPETLVESTLFGHTKGAYTGAASARDGLMKQADGGTLFLDEIGELPLQVQTSFLRVLETRRFRPVGGGKEISSDFRIVAATNQDLDQLVKDKLFRKDLLYRLRTFSLKAPPLRERLEDIPRIVEYHLKELGEAYEVGEKKVSDDFLATLARYSWPGNIRELVNALERSLIAARDEQVLYSKHLPTNIRIELTRHKDENEPPPPETATGDAPGEPIDLPPLQEVREKAKARAEKDYLEELMAKTGGDIKLACQVSELSRSRLYGLLKKHGVSR